MKNTADSTHQLDSRQPTGDSLNWELLADEIKELHREVKAKMDLGLSPSEFSVSEAVLIACDTALEIIASRTVP